MAYSALKTAIAGRNKSGYDRAHARQMIASSRLGQHAEALGSLRESGFKSPFAPKGMPTATKYGKSQHAADVTRRKAKAQYKKEGLGGPGPKPVGTGKYWLRQPAGSPRGGQFKGK